MIFNKKHWELTINVISLLFIVLFVYAAISKLLDFETFTVQLAQSPVLSAYAGIIAWMVPSMEICISVLLISERTRTLALYAAFFLMIMFTAYIFIILNYSDFIPCSCGGVLENLSWTQHLIFNVVFIAMAAVAIFLCSPDPKKNKVLLLAVLAIIGIGTVTLLFVFSEKKIHRNNAFQRRYLPHPIEKIGEFSLDYDTFYLAGYADSIAYLGNFGAPLYLTTNNIITKEQKVLPLELNDESLPYKKIKIRVKPPIITLADGTVPVVLQGDMDDLTLSKTPFHSIYFTQFVTIDSIRQGIVTVDAKSANKLVGLTSKINGTDTFFKPTKLRTALSEPFADDGLLTWNEDLNYFLYTYYYKNKYEVFDQDLNFIRTGSTIDTVNKPLLHVTYSKKEDMYTLGGKSITINRLSTSANNYLFINSDRLGRFEDEGPLKSASIIDVYNIIENSYNFSFYLYHQPGTKLYDFQVYNNVLIALAKNKLFIYRLKPEYFDSSSNPTHTGQYQD
ncbi:MULTISPECIES: MauE/DoxX family redox-associated membrane protein [Aequorivita]|uniref:Methylamine utilisation protein MauE domain-containing protein n=1 Tax=Aequorivita iocasae TaxID=2803865 RepID=A0ABX7DRP3_9FLAO|nr:MULTISPECIES: MauE/DoxX family redox-associated membrane protein [Aequorivita]QQX76467.1 hypothetical protein JK629_14255 [Aequorivita iocasae]UCA55939.1 hypothetical protein LDL78_14325 [Aequorivita sp. F7]